MIKLVGEAETKSELSEAFAAYRSGKLSEIEYHQFNAVWVVQNLHAYKPIPLERLPAKSFEYVQARLDRRRDYNYPDAYALGMWFAKMQESHLENQANVSLLNWCKEKLAGVAIADAIPKLDRAIRGFLTHQVDSMTVARVMRVKELDADARVRGSAK